MSGNNIFQVKDDHLYISECDAVELAKTYGTPAYIMDENYMRSVCHEYMQTIKNNDITGKILYASKAFLNTAITKIVTSEGLGIDVVSSGELFTVLNAGVDPKKIYMHGNNKSYADLTYAIDAGINCIVVDNIHEITLIDSITQKLNKTMNILIRIKPGIEAHTHEYIKTGTMDTKFGLGITDGVAMEGVKAVLACKNLTLMGFHCHIGSQIFETEAFLLTVDVIMDFTLQVKHETGYYAKELNFGGGFGIHYTDEDQPLKPQEYLDAIIKRLKARCEKENVPMPIFVAEPGRSIVGEAGVTLYTVGEIKDIANIRKYISVDGGMTDNPRVALYQAKYDAVIANKASQKATDIVTVAGRCCESGDVLIHDIALQNPVFGDILAVFSTGAYNFSMANNYNKLPLPPVVLVKGCKHTLITKRQTFEDLIKNDIMPDWL